MSEDDVGWEIGNEPDEYWESGEYYLELWRDREEEKEMRTPIFVYIVLKTDYTGITGVEFASLDNERAKRVYLDCVREQFADTPWRGRGIDIPSDWDFEQISLAYEESRLDYPDPLYYEFVEKVLDSIPGDK
jgi:hypothetical protein